MKTKLTRIKKNRRYSEEFKRQIVKEFESGRYSVPGLEKIYGICNVSIYSWIYKYSSYNEKGYRIMEMKKSSTSKLREMEQRIKDLEQVVGQKQIKIEYYEKMLELAKEQFDMDLKKNFDTPQSGGSKNTKTK
jgi:transposase-like protein